MTDDHSRSSDASAPRPASAVLPASPGAMALFASCMGLVAAALAVLIAVQAGFGLAWWASLAIGRIRAACLFATLHGVAGLAVASALATCSGRTTGEPYGPSGAPEPRSVRLAAWSLAAGTVLGVASVLAGAMTAGGDGGGSPPGLVLVLVAVGWASCARALWRVSAPLGSGLPVWVAFGLTGSVCATAYALVLAAAAFWPSVPVAALAGRAGFHGLAWLALGTAGLAWTAMLLPADTHRPLFGGRAVWLGLTSWLAAQALAAAGAGGPDLLPAWLARLVPAAAVLAVLAAVLLFVAFAGTLVGSPPVRPASPAARFAMAGALTLLLGAASESMRIAYGQHAAALTGWSWASSLVPVSAPFWLLGVGATYHLATPGDRGWRAVAPRRHLWIMLLALALLWAPEWPLALVRVADRPSADLVALSGRLALPGAALLLIANVLWVANMTGAWRSRGARPTSPAVLGRSGPGREVLVGGAVTLLAAVFFLILFLPSADPGMRPSGDRARRQAVAPGSLAERGRGTYVGDGCAACHTQRVRPIPMDLGLGPALAAGDHGDDIGQAGQARLGPDLAWVGDRYRTSIDMARALAVHQARGRLPQPWLWSEAGAPADGGALIDYLLTRRAEDWP